MLSKSRSTQTALAAVLALTGIAVSSCGASGPKELQLPPTAVVFAGARLITGSGGTPIEDALFVVDEDRFRAVGRRGDWSIPSGITTVDLTGKTVMPAIIDTHKHLSDNRETLIQQLRQLAYYGVGVAMNLGSDAGDLAFQVRAETIPGAARLRTAGRGITSPEPGRTEVPYWVKTEAEARQAVDEVAVRKVDLVKIWVDDRNGAYKKLSPELYTAIIDEAHRNSLRVTAHIFALEDAKGLLRAGIDAFAHGIRDRDIDDEVVALFGQHPNVVVVPNLPDRGVATDLGWIRDTVPADELERLQETASQDRPDAQQTFGIQARNLARLNAAGVRIALGTDGNTTWSSHQELEDMVAAGMTPAEVLVAATKNSAELLQLSDTGTIEEGKSADFVVLDRNPLEDITNTRRIADVYLRGSKLDRAAMKAGWTN
ncbi:MAG TPA: amidohydrolase family protein [Terriglobia bacterium]|nr:amidohydrolase family protein [Terriglobia bacterium]